MTLARARVTLLAVKGITAALLGALVTGACTTVLGIDGDYRRASSDGGNGGEAGGDPSCSDTCNDECMSCDGGKTGEADGVCAPVRDGEDDDCPGSQRCYGGACRLGVDGEPCDGDGNCDNECVKGLCCNASCNGDCVSCLGAETGMADGVCAPVSAGTDPDNDCQGNDRCDGNGNCVD